MKKTEANVMWKNWSILMLLLLSITSYAYDTKINGIYYNIDYNAKTADVTYNQSVSYNSYSGIVSIPDNVTYNGVTYQVTSIGQYAFRGCTGLTSVIIPSSIKNICEYAFWGSEKLTSVDIPYGVLSLEEGVFSACTSLESIKIPQSVVSIGNEAFRNCNSLTDVTIPDNVSIINDNCFSGCSNLTSVKLSTATTEICDYAFANCKKLKSIVIPNNVTTIGQYAFSGCGLTSITIPNGVVSIGASSFYLCSNLISVSIPNSVVSFGNHSFQSCNGLVSVTIEAENPIDIYKYTFSNAKNATLYVPQGSKSAYQAANYWKEFKEIVEYSTLNDGDTFTAKTVEGIDMTFKVISAAEKTCQVGNGVSSAINQSTSGTVTIPSTINGFTVTSIGNSAFSGCGSLASVTIPNSVKNMGDYAFSGCNGLTSVHISDLSAWCNISFSSSNSNPLSYAHLLYLNGSEIKNLVIPNGVKSIGQYAFYSCIGLTSVTIPSSVTSIGTSAFKGCGGLSSVTIPSSVTSIEKDAFVGCTSLTSVHISDLSAWCNISFSSNSNPLSYAHQLYLNGSEIKKLVIPNSVTSIGDKAFSGFTGLTSVTIPNSVTSIGNYTFSYCSDLTSVTIANGVTSIGYGAFQDCSGLTSITIPNGVTSIGQSAFSGCSGLTSITIPNSVTSIGDNAFYGCYGLTSITIPNSVTSIGDYAFPGYRNLTTVTVERTTPITIGSNTFPNRTNATLYVPQGCKSAYQAANYWKEFKLIVEYGVMIEPTGIGTLTASNIEAQRATVTATLTGDLEDAPRVTIKYGTNADNLAYSKTIDEAASTITINLTGLLQNTTYYVKVILQTDNGTFDQTISFDTKKLDKFPVAEAVDLGLSSGLKWASWNVGSTSPMDVPETQYARYGWGDPTGEVHSLYAGDYAISQDTEFKNGDVIDIAGTQYDIATVQWGTGWRMPRLSDFEELINECTAERGTFTDANGVSHYGIKFIGPNGRSILLPAAGLKNSKGTLVSDNSLCAYWASTNLNNVSVPIPIVYTTSLSVDSKGPIYYQLPIRPVYESDMSSTTYTLSVSSSSGGIVTYSGEDIAGTTQNYTVQKGTTHTLTFTPNVGCYLKSLVVNGVDVTSSVVNNQYTTIIVSPNTTVKVTFEEYSFKDGETFTAKTVEGIDMTFKVISAAVRTCQVGDGESRAINLASSGTITIPNTINGYTVTRIGSFAFYDCTIVTSVTIPNSVTSIGQSAFSGCSGLTSITIPNSVTSIEYSAFSGCSGLISITIPSSVTSIGGYAFFGCSDLTSIEIPNSVTSIGDKAFSGCSGMTSITIPNSVTSIGQSAFSGCSGLTSVTIPNSVKSIGNSAFSGCSGLTSVTIPSSVKSIGNSAFSSCSGLTSVTIPNSVTSIGNSAFYNCSGLTSVTIPNSVMSIGVQAFSYCSDLTSVTVERTTPISIGSNVFSNRANATLYVPRGSKSAYQAADYWKEFKEIVEYSTLKDGDTFTAKTVEGVDMTFKVISVADKTCLVGNGESAAIDNKTSGAVTISNTVNGFTVTSIGQYAFSGCSSLASVNIPNSVTSIRNYAFLYCNSLKAVHISDLAAWCNISLSSDSNPLEYAHHLYLNDSEIKDLVIPNSVTSIGDYAFSGCSGLTSVTISNSVKIIGESTFQNCSSLTSTTFGSGMTGIGQNAFYNCSDLTSITIPNSVTSIGNYAFAYCSGLTSVTMEKDAPISITSETFSNRTNATLYVPQGSKVAYWSADYWTEFKKIVELGETTTYSLTITSSTGGSVTYSGEEIVGTTQNYTVEEGTSATLTFTPNSGYRISSVMVNGTDVTTNVVNNQYTINDISQNTTVSVTFEEIPVTPPSTYVLTIYLPKHGYVETALEETSVDERAKYYSMDEGSSQTFTFVADRGYRLESVRVNGEDVTASVVNNHYTIENVNMDVDVRVTFVADHEQTWTVAGDVPSLGSAWDSTNTANDMSSADGVNFTLVMKIVVLEASLKYTYKVVADHEWGEEYPADEAAEITVKADGLYTITFTFNKDSKRVSAEVTKIDLAEMAADGVNFTVTSYADRTVNVTAGSYGKVLTVPATVEYEGLTWTVKGIDRDVLADKTDLAAIVWNPDVAFTAEVPNPNLLLYVKSAGYAPSAVNNVVVNGVAQRITLTEAGSSNDFYCPQAFTARSITYSHSYQMTTGIDKCQGWETIALPFDVQTVSHATKGTVVPFAARTNNGQKAFWLYELTSSGWRAATAVKANTPYIISMPNNELYYDEARLNGRITFSATDVTVPVTSETSVTYRGRTFVPNFLRQQQRAGVYTLNVNNDWFTSTNGTEGSLFVANQRSVSPFEAYMTTTSGARTSFGIFEDTTTEIRGVEELIDARRVDVYNLNGQKRKTGDDASMDGLKRTLPAGVYIINGQKIIVR